MAFQIILKILCSLFCISNAQRGLQLDTYTLEIISGSNVSILCKELKIPAYKYVSLEHSTNTSRTRILTMDFRRQKVEKYPNEDYADRVFFHNANPPYFQMINIQSQDEGTFTCEITPKRQKIAIQNTYMKVIDPPTSVTVFDVKGRQIQNMAGPFNQGSKVQLICMAEGGRPPPHLTWFKNNTPEKSINIKNQRRVDGRNVTILVIESLKRRDKYNDFQCVASNHAEVQIKSSVFKLDIYTLPKIIEFITRDIPLIAGERYEVSCITQGSKPHAKMAWSIASVPLPNHREDNLYEKGNGTVSTLELIPAENDDGKDLSCLAEHPTIKEQGIKADRKLIIHYAPNVTLEFKPNNTVNDGDPVSLICHVDANPPPFKISFYKGHHLMEEAKDYVEKGNSSLTILKTSRKFAGHYSCVASNQVGEGSTKSIRDGRSSSMELKVRHIPQCKKKVQIVGAGTDEVTSFTCDVSAYPPVKTFSWTFNRSGVIDAVDRSSFTTSGELSKMTFIPIKEEDFGIFLCYAENAYGKMEEPCVFEIKRAELPDRLENCTLVNRTATTLYVGCIAGKDGGLPQKFVTEVFDTSKNVHVINSTSSQPYFLMEELNPSTMYLITLYSFNSKGQSEKIFMTHNTTKEPEGTTLAVPAISSLPIKNILGILLGVFGALIFVAIILAAIMHIRSTNGMANKKSPENTSQISSKKASGSDQSGIPHKFKSANLYEMKTTKEEKPGEVEYAQLDFPNGSKKDKSKKKKQPKKQKNDDKTLYAAIDINKTEKARLAKEAQAQAQAKKSASAQSSNEKDKLLSSQPGPSTPPGLVKLSDVKKPLIVSKQSKPTIPSKPTSLSPKTKPAPQPVPKDQGKEKIPLMTKTLESNL